MALTKSNYKPISLPGVSYTATAHPMFTRTNAHLDLWSLILLDGKATVNNTNLSNAAVLIGTGATVSIGNAKYITFTDTYGNYGISLPVSGTYSIKIYS